jgi:hypothetical protein
VKFLGNILSPTAQPVQPLIHTLKEKKKTSSKHNTVSPPDMMGQILTIPIQCLHCPSTAPHSP